MDKLDKILGIQDDAKREIALVQYINILEQKVKLLDDAIELSGRIERFNDKLVDRNNYLEHENARLLFDFNQRLDRMNDIVKENFNFSEEENE